MINHPLPKYMRRTSKICEANGLMRTVGLHDEMPEGDVVRWSPIFKDHPNFPGAKLRVYFTQEARH